MIKVAPVKVALGLLAAVLATILAARLAYHASADARPASSIGDAASLQPWAQRQMEFVAWNDERWTAWIRNNTFELVPEHAGKWRQHENVSLAFIDWQRQPWQAKVDGETFLLAYRGEWKGRVERADALRYRDWSDRPQLRTAAQLRR